MKPENVLLSTWSIPMGVVDVALYSNILYVLETTQMLHLYSYHEPVLSVQPIYTDPYPTQFLKGAGTNSIGTKRRSISFVKPIRDFVIYRHRFYYLNEDGLFVWAIEQGESEPVLLVEGIFHSLRLSPSNHLFLASSNGLYEYRFGANGSAMLKRLDSSPTHGIEVERNQVVQYNDRNEPFQRLDLVSNHRNVYVERTISVQNLHAENTMIESLELDETVETFHPMPLFDFLPQNPKQMNHHQTESRPIIIRPLPSAALGGVLLDENTIHFTVNDQSLQLFAGRTPYYKIPLDDTRRIRIYPKSRKFQHHLHIVRSDRMDFYLFTRIG